MKNNWHGLSTKTTEPRLSEPQQASFLHSDGQAPEAGVELPDECLAMIYGGSGPVIRACDQSVDLDPHRLCIPSPWAGVPIVP